MCVLGARSTLEEDKKSVVSVEESGGGGPTDVRNGIRVVQIIDKLGIVTLISLFLYRLGLCLNGSRIFGYWVDSWVFLVGPE